jgi:hypothetical protein
MIQQPTVLILGAGASHPYGYPLGGELVRIIAQKTATGGELRAALSYDLTMTAFHTRLRESEVLSIDDFLESNPAFAPLGKMCIVAALTVWGPRHDHEPNAAAHWYKYLWGRLHEGAATSEDFRRNHLRIITYNYEMSLERYFSRVLSKMYPDLADASEPAVAGFLREVIPIVHLHGTLGNADAVVQPRIEREAYLDPNFLGQTANGVRIVHEDESTREYETAHEWLREAVNLHILGFGYHATNIRRLDLVTQTRAGTTLQAFGGTALGMEEGERTRANRAINFRGGSLYPIDCLQYLRSQAILE